MFDWLRSLTDTTGFVPRSQCGAWTPEWIAVHTGSDILIWLAYLSIPLVLLGVARHPAVRPFRPLVFLFAAFILACGTTHLIEAVIFEQPVYRLSGVLKAMTAVVSWATVFALIPAVTRLLPVLDQLVARPAPTPARDPDADKPFSLVYSLAILMALLATLIRYALDPVLGDTPAFGVSIMAVIFVGWYAGFGPGLVTLLLSGLLSMYLFLPPRQTLWVEGVHLQVDSGLYLVTGIGVLILGELQRTTRRRLHGKVLQLWAAREELTAEKRKADETLASLDALVRNAPYGIAFFDPDLRYIRVNDTFARANGVPPDDMIGRPLPEVLSDYPADLLAEYRHVLATGETLTRRTYNEAGSLWELTAFPVPLADGLRGLGVIGVDVTDRHRHEEQLRESAEKFQAMADGIPQLAWMTRPDGHIFWYNQRWYDYTGTTLEEMEGWGWQAVHDPVELKRVMVSWPKALAAGEPFEETFPLRRHDGQMRWHLTRAVPLKDAAGKVLLWFGTNTDITAQRELEHALRETTSQLTQLTEGMPLLMWACRPTGECDYLSRQWLDYTGLPLDEQLGKGWLTALHPDDRAGTTTAWQAAVGGAAEYDLEYRIRRHDGVYRWFATRGIPVRDQVGRITRWYGSCTDIDDRKHYRDNLERMVAERTAQIREQQTFLNTTLDNVAEGIVACDASGRLKLFNAAAKKMHALPAEPLAADRWAERYRLFEADGVTPMATDNIPLFRAWRGEEVREAELVIRSDGQPDRYVLCFGQQLHAADGNVSGAVVSMRDITERREYERQLLLTHAALRASNEDLEKFAYVASHDLQEPLRKIQAFGTRLADRYREVLGEQGQGYLERMTDAAGRMRRLIEDLLSLSRVSSKPIAFQPVDLGRLVHDVLGDIDEQVRRTGGRVDVGPLPTVVGDPGQLRQLFQNLIGNALKFARPNVPPEVRVTAVPFDVLSDDDDQPPGPGWRITVTDNGIGFEPEYAERIFELFQRLHSRAKYEGTGLGLAIVRKIAVRHGATVSAHGRPGEGATFTLDWLTRVEPE